jgi:hypothetical protein
MPGVGELDQSYGTNREHGRGKRRAFQRFFALQEALSHESPDAALPAVVGAIAGG